MIKSLQDIEKDFQEQQQPESPKKKDSKVSLLSDVVFCIALIGVGLSAIILSWGEHGGAVGGIYEALGTYREVVLLVFLALIVISFVLRFLGNKEKD